MWYQDRAELDRISKVGVRTYFNDQGDPVVRMHSSFLLVCERDDTAFTIPVMVTGNWEAWNATAISNELSEPFTRFIDVGANVGYYGVMAATSGVPTVMFEPNPALIPFIEESVRINKCENNALIRNFGLGSNDATMKLYTHDKHSGANSLFGSGDQYIEVKIKTLDDSIFPMHSYKYVVKVDVEGFERNVWEGAKTLRETTDNVWFCEWVPARFTDAENRDFLEDVLQSHDLQIVNHHGGFRAVSVNDALSVQFETIVFRKRK